MEDVLSDNIVMSLGKIEGVVHMYSERWETINFISFNQEIITRHVHRIGKTVTATIGKCTGKDPTMNFIVENLDIACVP